MSTRLITAAKIRTICGLPDTVDDTTRILPFLDIAQKRHLKKIWGITLYDRVIAAVEADTISSEPELVTLLDDYAHDYLAWKTLELALPRIYAAPNGNGIYTTESEKHKPVDRQTLGDNTSGARANADACESDMVLFLENNPTDYPEYTTTTVQDQRATDRLPGGFVTRKMKGQYDTWNPGRRGTNYTDRMNSSRFDDIP